jgi:L-serine dehydratase
MESISIFDIFKVGVGPSSSHTLGPWKAAIDFASILDKKEFDCIKIHLYGSLSKTGKGHATDKAVQLGLEGYQPETIDTRIIPEIIQVIQNEKVLLVNGKQIQFTPSEHIKFHKNTRKIHPNTLVFQASRKGRKVASQTYMSIGGGFIEKEGYPFEEGVTNLRFPINSGKEILEYTRSTKKSISDIVYENELCFRPAYQIEEKLSQVFNTMLQSVYRGCSTDGILPGGLNVKRRAKPLCQELLLNTPFHNIEDWKKLIFKCTSEFNAINKWVSCFALAVNEENAALGRIVTSPTNGAAGVIPAVLLYHYFFCDHRSFDDVRRFLFVAGEIGSLFKKGATISAAVGGCQAEIGVSSAMAAGALTEILGGSPEQVLMAAEIAMEHHLGMTCDPVGGLVQVPCIERNAMGAMKAITACNLALSSDPSFSKVHIDTVIQTMWDTAQAMNKRYKETSEGGLAYHLPVILPEC